MRRVSRAVLPNRSAAIFRIVPGSRKPEVFPLTGFWIDPR